MTYISRCNCSGHIRSQESGNVGHHVGDPEESARVVGREVHVIDLRVELTHG